MGCVETPSVLLVISVQLRFPRVVLCSRVVSGEPNELQGFTLLRESPEVHRSDRARSGGGAGNAVFWHRRVGTMAEEEGKNAIGIMTGLVAAVAGFQVRCA